MDAKMKETLKSIYGSLTDEQKKKAKECKDMDELMKLAGEWGIELPDEVLDSVAGGLAMAHAIDFLDAVYGKCSGDGSIC